MGIKLQISPTCEQRPWATMNLNNRAFSTAQAKSTKYMDFEF